MCPKHSLKHFPVSCCAWLASSFLFILSFRLSPCTSLFPSHPLPLLPSFFLHLRHTGYVSSHLFHLSSALILCPCTWLNNFHLYFFCWGSESVCCTLDPRVKQVKGPYCTTFCILFCSQTSSYKICAILNTGYIFTFVFTLFFTLLWLFFGPFSNFLSLRNKMAVEIKCTFAKYGTYFC